MDHQALGRLLISAGLLIAAVGGVLLFSDKFTLLGRLPGDFRFESERFTVYIPIATSIVLSIVLTIALQFWSRR